MSTLPPLPAIRCFEAAARHGNFTRAAEELGMTQAAVSYQIKLLEDRMGPLFIRQARSVVLTETGKNLAPMVTEAFTLLRAAFEDADRDSSRVLTISASVTFTSHWLVPRLGAFRQAWPDTTVRIEATHHLVDLVGGEADLAIRIGRGNWPGLTCHRLFPVHFTPVLSPALLAQVGPAPQPADLLRLPLIEPDDPWWQDWFSSAGVPTPDFTKMPGVHVGTQPMAATMALAGEGVAILTPAFFRDDLAQGRLVQPFALMHESASCYWLAYATAKRHSRKIRAFRDWLLALIARDGPEL